MIGKYGVDEILCKWCEEAGIDYRSVYYNITHHIIKNGCELTIYHPFPGYLIGKAGVYINKYKQELEQELKEKVEINLIEARVPMSSEEWKMYFKSRGF